MSAEPDLRGPHPCLDRGCGHPEADHWPTPELAGPAELVVWCVSCRRHEVRRARVRWRHSEAAQRLKRVAIFGRAN